MTEVTQASSPNDEPVADLDELREVLPTKFSIASFGADLELRKALVEEVMRCLGSGVGLVPPDPEGRG